MLWTLGIGLWDDPLTGFCQFVCPHSWHRKAQLRHVERTLTSIVERFLKILTVGSTGELWERERETCDKQREEMRRGKLELPKFLLCTFFVARRRLLQVARATTWTSAVEVCLEQPGLTGWESKPARNYTIAPELGWKPLDVDSFDSLNCLSMPCCSSVWMGARLCEGLRKDALKRMDRWVSSTLDWT